MFGINDIEERAVRLVGNFLEDSVRFAQPSGICGGGGKLFGEFSYLLDANLFVRDLYGCQCYCLLYL